MELNIKALKLHEFNQPFASNYEKIAFKLSLMLLVLDGSTGWNAEIPLRILCTLMLVFDKYVTNRILWTVISITLLYSNSLQWYVIDNHKALFMYWTFVLTIFLWLKKEKEYLVNNARLLIGLVMAFAVIQKVLNGFYEPGFLHGRFLFDSRFLMITHFITGIPLEDLNANKLAINAIKLLPMDGIYTELISSLFMKKITYAFQVFGLFVEATVAVFFLFGEKFKGYRDYILIAFCIGTYFIFPVIGFSSILLLLGITQVESSRIFRHYIWAFILIQFIKVPWQSILFYFENMS